MGQVGAKLGVIAVFAGLLVTGCTAHTVSAPTPTATADWSAKRAAFIARFGEPPRSDPPFSDAQAHEVSTIYADRSWAILLTQYPTATRPTDPFVHWATDADSDIAGCYTAAGATSDPGTTADGQATRGFSGPATEAFAVASFDCDFVRFPVRPSPWPTDAQIGYYYDYLTHYLVPCYLGHGAKVDLVMPTRDEFIAEYQFDHTGSRWQLTPPDAADAPDPTYDGAGAVCSAIAPGGLQP